MQDSFRDLYRLGELDSRKVVVDIPGSRITVNAMDGPGGQALQVCMHTQRLDCAACFLPVSLRRTRYTSGIQGHVAVLFKCLQRSAWREHSTSFHWQQHVSQAQAQLCRR